MQPDTTGDYNGNLLARHVVDKYLCDDKFDVDQNGMSIN